MSENGEQLKAQYSENKKITDGKAKEWPLYDLKDKQVMVLDEFDIHPAKESDVKIVDWDRTYFLTKYYML